MLKGGPGGFQIEVRTGPCWGYVGSFFALGRLFFALGHILNHFLLILNAFWSLVLLFFACWDAQNMILEGPGKVLEALKPCFSFVFRIKEHALPSCSQYNKPHFLLGFTDFRALLTQPKKRFLRGSQSIFGHGAGMAAKNPCRHSLSSFCFHLAARRYVRSTSAASRRDCRACRTLIPHPLCACL